MHCKLEYITIGEGVNELSNDVFKFNKSLQQIIIPPSVKYIRFEAFADCGLENITIGKEVIKVEKYAFSNNNLKNVYIINPATIIHPDAFTNFRILYQIKFYIN